MKALFMVLGALGLAACAFYRFVPHATAVHLAHASTSSVTGRAIQPAAALPDTGTMARRINDIINQYPSYQIGVAIVDLNRGKAYDYGEDAPFIAASTGKLITATLFLHEVDNGRYSLNTDVDGDAAQDQLERLIVNSDNTAWQNLDDLLGDDALQAWATASGLSSYDVSTNEITPADMATLLAKLYQGQLLGSASTKLLLGYMKEADHTELIDSAVPAGVTVYHKAGWLDDRQHDAAIIDDGHNPYVLVIYSKIDSGTYDIPTGEQFFHDITQATLDTF